MAAKNGTLFRGLREYVNKRLLSRSNILKNQGYPTYPFHSTQLWIPSNDRRKHRNFHLPLPAIFLFKSHRIYFPQSYTGLDKTAESLSEKQKIFLHAPKTLITNCKNDKFSEWCSVLFGGEYLMILKLNEDESSSALQTLYLPQWVENDAILISLCVVVITDPVRMW